MSSHRTINILQERLTELERVHNATSPMNDGSHYAPSGTTVPSTSQNENRVLNGDPNWDLYQITPPTHQERSFTFKLEPTDVDSNRTHSIQIFPISETHDMEGMTPVQVFLNQTGEHEQPRSLESMTTAAQAERRSLRKRREKLIKINPRMDFAMNGAASNQRTIEMRLDRTRDHKKERKGASPIRSVDRLDSTPFTRTDNLSQRYRSLSIPIQSTMELLPLPTDFAGVLEAAKDTSNLWFSPDCSTSETRRRLEPQLAGSFLVRRSSNEGGSFKLTFKNPDGTIQRAILDQVPDGFVIRHVRDGLPYPSLIHLIGVHCYCATILPCLLRLPGYELSRVMNYPLSQSVHNLHAPNGMAEEHVRESQLSRSNSTRRSAKDRKREETLSPSRSPSSKWIPRPNLILPQGAACRLLYFGQFGVGSLDGPSAVRVCVDHVFRRDRHSFKPVLINFRVHESGITMTDLENRLFTQRHYPSNFVQYIGIDPLQRTWKYEDHSIAGTLECCVFGFVTRNPNSVSAQNQCHLLSEYDPTEAAQVICEFTSRYLDLPTV